jgi:histidinol-phosphatase
VTTDLEFARRLADRADEIAMRYFTSGAIAARAKNDGSPVTDADEEIEHTLRSLIRRERGGDAFLGEESGAHGRGDRVWIVDPLDGTASFVAGEPEWSTLIGLAEHGTVSLGLVSAPACARRWWAARGNGAWTNALPTPGHALPHPHAAPQRLAVVGTERLRDAAVGIWPPPGRLTPRHADIAARIAATAGRTVPALDWTGPPPATRIPKPSTGTGTCHGGLLVATNQLDAFLLFGAGAWDVAALVPIVEEAGGVSGGLDGSARADTAIALFAANRALYRQILDVVQQVA